jgi:GNAT superfamily N-acetyltransferase
MEREWQRDGYLISTDPRRIDLELVHRVLAQSYWATGIPRETVRRSIEGSLVFGLYHQDRQIGFARAVTDRATFAYVADVFVLDEFRGRGLGAWLMATMVAHPDLQGLRRWVLLTRDAHGLYRKFGFTEVAKPERYMELWTPDVYRAAPAADQPR